MTQWAERVRNHSVWQQLQSLGPVLDQAAKREGIDPQTSDSLERLRAVLAFSGKRLAGADPALVPPGPLDGISTAFQNAIAEVQAFISDGNAGHISIANVHGDTGLVHVAQVTIPFTSEELTSLKDAATSYRESLFRSLEQARAGLDSVRVESEALRAKLAELGNDISGEKQRTVQLAADQQSQFSAAQENRVREFTDAQTARQDKFATAIADYGQRLAEQNADFTLQKEAAVRASQEAITELRSNHAQKADAILQQMRQHERDVEKLVGVIGNLGVTSGYSKTANQARVPGRLGSPRAAPRSDVYRRSTYRYFR
jgi:hypothetical protein